MSDTDAKRARLKAQARLSGQVGRGNGKTRSGGPLYGTDEFSLYLREEWQTGWDIEDRAREKLKAKKRMV